MGDGVELQRQEVAELDLRRIGKLAALHLDRFRSLTGSDSGLEELDASASFVAWVAYVVPGAVGKHLRQALDDTRLHSRRCSDFRTNGWHKMLPLDTALFAITNDPSYLDLVLANLSHRKYFFRRHVANVLALVAPQLVFDPELFDRAMRENVDQGHPLHETALLSAVAWGSAEEKQRWLGGWCSVARMRQGSVFRLAAGESVPNPFLEPLMAVNNYALLQLARKLPGVPELKTGAGTEKGIERKQPEFGHRIHAGAAMDSKLRSHPLFKAELKVEDRPG